MSAFFGDCVCGKPGGQWLYHCCHDWQPVYMTRETWPGSGEFVQMSPPFAPTYRCRLCGEVGYPIRAAS